MKISFPDLDLRVDRFLVFEKGGSIFRINWAFFLLLLICVVVLLAVQLWRHFLLCLSLVSQHVKQSQQAY